MADFKLPRLQKGWRDQPLLLERYWDIAMTQIERTLNAILDIPAIEAALVAVAAATAAANAAANNAQAAADGVTTDTSLVNSYPTNPSPSPLISADNAGNVTVNSHQRVYGDSVLNPTVLVIGGGIATGASPGEIVRVYYDDPTRSGGSVTYLFTVDPAPVPVQTGNTHSVGAVEIPSGGPVDGGPVRPPGYANPIP